MIAQDIMKSAGVAPRPIYELSGVSRYFKGGEITALDGVDFEIAQGEFHSVIGSSGCGKTTLLKIMAGLMPPSEGRVMLGGKPVLGPRDDIGMMFQQATMFPWRTTIENILLPIEIRRGRKAAMAARPRAEDLLKVVGLAGFEDVYPSSLSGGMAQRAAICRMLISDPDVLLLDEPFSALDEITRDFMNLELQKVCMERNASAFLVTHSISEAVILSDTVHVMSARPGRVVKSVKIDLPRPRTLEMTTLPEFGAYATTIRNLLDKGAFL
ncbi:ABC transporter ATP-binding protein [Pacificitalea manganoxidans]|uniref:ABC transporter ATP-binding protein n=1 Tax=Pacificitalea manganoxidans TaxID=1411902 RepID=A0A291M143_9RHOB|nr:ABC transporter ATP-binding protein [Pacificitalea manganoxidans]MAQ46946.1 ABC transporter ATP-binding protein [Actibacterium sp.]OWU68933.1 ABC transporter ATP-binding protein [Roseovarius sp. 22II1-1F6A]ATI42681.1 ABC transporter ATP-binding protein [Pacificitalea manganoxidans]MBF52586.1 ABC transporter ATP-binding protein [Actibacterium sp.]MDR6307436.1 NitT/TauT family transport system ATP-binding protein [Pacificitalea manganoxidans]|tara:strand:+ start:2686 stop:3492 length:807 start_codon:yes stop_codon:yes gene_type:complete